MTKKDLEKLTNIPTHVAIIMDGNRRFARKNNYARAQGHLLGFDKLAEVRVFGKSFVWLNLLILKARQFIFTLDRCCRPLV